MKPMLACSTIPKVEEISYPVYASPKLDGIRCLIKDGVALSRSLKPIPNKFIQSELAKLNLDGCDGEIMVKGDFNAVQSAAMRVEGEPDFEYHVFDLWNRQSAFIYRVELLFNKISCREEGVKRLKIVEQRFCRSSTMLNQYVEEWLAKGYEGAIVRNPNSPYKFGRSTLKQGWMLKLKKFRDAEAVIVGVEELMHNDNEAEEDNLGYQVRSHKLEGQVPGNTLGALVCEFGGTRFKIGTGFTPAQRAQLWAMDLRGDLVTFKYQELSKYGVPRFPVFKQIRNKGDLG